MSEPLISPATKQSSQTGILLAELMRLQQWFKDRDDRPGHKAQFIHIGIAMDAAARALPSETPMLHSATNVGTDPHVAPLCVPSARAKLTDEQIMNAACTAADALDATRVSEMVPGGWKATTIFEGDTGLLRFGRLIEKAINGK